MHKITDQIKLLMVQKKSPKRRNEGKNWGKKLNMGKKTNEGEIIFGENQISYLISSSYCNLRYLSLHQ